MTPQQDKILTDAYKLCLPDGGLAAVIELVREHDAKLAAGDAWRSGGGGKCSMLPNAAEIERLKKELAEARLAAECEAKAGDEARRDLAICRSVAKSYETQVRQTEEQRDEARAQLAAEKRAHQATLEAAKAEREDDAKRLAAAREQGRQEAREGIVSELERQVRAYMRIDNHCDAEVMGAAATIARNWTPEGGAK